MKLAIIGIILLLFFAGCRDGKHPDVSKLLTDRKINRFDRDLFALDKEHPDIEMMRRKYGHYFDLYAEGILQLGRVSDTNFKNLLPLFLQDTIINEVYDSVARNFPDLSAQEKDISLAFAYYAWYFPGKAIPEVYTHISGFNQSVVVDSAVVGISLDNYLGENCPFYSMLADPVPMYARRKMNGQNIARDVVYGWLSAEFVFHPHKTDMISSMVYQGKIIYLMEKLFPDYKKHRLFDFTDDQLKWCETNEGQIWGFLIENEYLFSDQQMLMMKYLTDAPFTSGMPAESPGRAVVWTGYKIVESYMAKSGITIQELMKEQDYHRILRGAGYRP